MKVYRHGEREKNLVLHVQPGIEFPDVEGWRDAQALPVLFTIQFKNWTATVDGNMGKYLIDKGYAQKSAISIPIIEDA